MKARRISKNTQTGQYKKSLLRHVETCPVEGFPSLKFLFSNRTMEEIWILPVLITNGSKVVRGLPDWTTEQQLKSDFAGCGPLKRVSCPPRFTVMRSV